MGMTDKIDEGAGGVLCDKCKGEGYVQDKMNPKIKVMCRKCQGDGKLDWVSRITGKPEISYSCSCGSSGTSGSSGSQEKKGDGDNC